jgi:hypothetical protein
LRHPDRRRHHARICRHARLENLKRRDRPLFTFTYNSPWRLRPPTDKTISVRHSDAWQRFRVEYRIRRNDTVDGQNVSRYRVDFIIRQRLWRRDRHGSPNIVEQRSGGRPITRWRFDWLSGSERPNTSGKLILWLPRALRPVAGLARFSVNRCARRNRPAARRQPPSIGNHGDVYLSNLFGRDRTSEVGSLRATYRRHQKKSQKRDETSKSRRRHFSPSHRPQCPNSECH